MESDLFLQSVVSLILLLTIAGGALLISKRLKFPFTVLLFLIGLGLTLLSQYIPYFHIVTHIKLSPDLIFYIFLPILLFESAYQMPYKKVIHNSKIIFSLSVIGILISTFCIAGSMYGLFWLFDIHIPFILLLLFGTLISATDPVAVLSLFKTLGIPKRLAIIFEGESVFNDGTALALFSIILGIIEAKVFEQADLLIGFFMFFFMMFFGILYGGFMGIFFSKIIEKMKNELWVEITLMIILAHTTFISAEIISHFMKMQPGKFFDIFQISPIIATVIASITLGNYGRYKISPQVNKVMDMFWEYFAFIANSLIFLMMGYLIGNMNIHWSEIYLFVAVAIIAVVVARAISVYGVLIPLNMITKEVYDKVPMSWIHLLSYGSLRGGLAIAMIMIIPAESVNTIANWPFDINTLSPLEFLQAITVGCIIFTLIVKATTLEKLIAKFNIGEYTFAEKFTRHEIQRFIDYKIVEQLKHMDKNNFILPENYNKLSKQYQEDADKSTKIIHKIEKQKNFQQEIYKITSKYALGIEECAAIELFEAGEIPERVLRMLLGKIHDQYERIDKNLPQLNVGKAPVIFLQRMLFYIEDIISPPNYQTEMKKKYMFYRARDIIASQVIEKLEDIHNYMPEDKKIHRVFTDIKQKYVSWQENARGKKKRIAIEEPELAELADLCATRQFIDKLKKIILMSLKQNRIILEKVYEDLKDQKESSCMKEL
jgi:monovalent cation:H+ antiporter, CPA1 family